MPHLDAQSPKNDKLFFRAVGALILREMSSTYGRSAGGYFWAIAHPIGVIGILALVFSFALRAPSLGTSFILFYATGVIALRCYLEVQNAVADAVNYNKALLAYPRVNFFDALFARAALCILTQVVVSAIVLGGFFIFSRLEPELNWLPIFEAFLMLVLLGVSVGTLNCYLFIAFPTWKTIWNVLSRPMFFLSGIFFVYEELPDLAQSILWFNPVLHLSGLARSGFYTSYHPNYISLFYVSFWLIIPLFFGLALLRKEYKSLVIK